MRAGILCCCLLDKQARSDQARSARASLDPSRHGTSPFGALFVSALLVISKSEWLLALYPRPDIDLGAYSREDGLVFPRIPKL